MFPVYFSIVSSIYYVLNNERRIRHYERWFILIPSYEPYTLEFRELGTDFWYRLASVYSGPGSENLQNQTLITRITWHGYKLES